MAEGLLATVAFAAVLLAGVGFLMHRLRMPTVIGYLVAGLVVSPFVLRREYFPPEVLGGFSDVMVLFLLFFIGLELDLNRLRTAIRTSSWAIPFHTFLPLVAVAGVGRLLGWGLAESLILGAAVAVSSTILADRLSNHRDMSAASRRRALGLTVVEDLISGILLAAVALLASGAALTGWPLALEGGRLLFFVVLLAASALLIVPRILDAVARSHSAELLVLWGIGLVVLWGYLGALVATAELGAFLAGVAAAEAGSRYVTRNALQGVRDAAIALFFFASGVATDILPTLTSPGPALLVAGVFLATKYAANVPAALASGLNLPDALRSAFVLGTVGEYGLIMVAVATRAGVAHPMLLPTVVGAMLVTLLVSAVLLHFAEGMARGFWRLPRPVRDPVLWLVTALRRVRPATGVGRERVRGALRALVANGLLLVGLALVVPLLAGRVAAQFSHLPALWVQAPVWGVALALALPLLLGAYRGYRDLVWSLVGLQPGERVGAGRVRMRLVDSLVAGTAVLLLAIATLYAPATLPLLGAAAAVALVIAAVAWRQLMRFHHALEDTVARVLGRESDSGELLDKILQNYPWGVRSSAVAVPPDSPVARRSVGGSRIGELTGAMVAVIHRRGTEIVNPAPETVILPGDTLVLMGDMHQLARAEALVVAHGQTLRLATTSKQVVVDEVTLHEGSPWSGQTLGETGLREATGTLVAGVWPSGTLHPVPYEPGYRLRTGDRILLLGTHLQVERAQELASPSHLPPPAAADASSSQATPPVAPPPPTEEE